MALIYTAFWEDLQFLWQNIGEQKKNRSHETMLFVFIHLIRSLSLRFIFFSDIYFRQFTRRISMFSK